ncbi:uncharacterized protein SAPINGB_P004146 [Magnusiomyces paraingens]|uniref:Membrane insertase YidC/Oxa/ALB C-terminal domain-containing protein n=1 Tax=Magnusiomyces paraingens TaxID=2606893 RepID=A0A5E8BVD2_9ASCO|nr:uncharacterized protein SAPINGB_P004146 [Saprochaete ingens]VVT54579.1 unnamed protein product [Saprochaete ingens]
MFRLQTRRFHASATRQFDLGALLEPVHSAVQAAQAYSGLSWHYMIPLATLAVRATTTLPVAIANRKRAQKQAELQPVLSAMTPILRARLAMASGKNSRGVTLTSEQISVLATKERRRRRVELFRKYRCQAWKSIVLLPAVQMPLWIALSLVFRSMCGWSGSIGSSIPLEQAFNSDAFLWCTDLVSPDPYGALPILVGILGMANIEWNAINVMNRAAAPTSTASVAAAATQGPSVPRIVANISRVAVMGFTTMAFQAPVAVCLYWVSSSSFSLLQNLAFDRWLPLQPYTPRPPTTEFNFSHGLSSLPSK